MKNQLHKVWVGILAWTDLELAAVLFILCIISAVIIHAQAPRVTADHQTRSEQSGNIAFSPQTLPIGSQIIFMDITATQLLQIVGPYGEQLVTISLKDGKVMYGKNYTPDAAAKAFWDAIGTKYPCETRKAGK